MEKLRSPSPLLVDTTARFIFLPTVPEMKPRTECACQAVAFMISARVAPPGRCSRSRILPVLLPARAVTCGAGWGAFFPRLALRGGEVFAGATRGAGGATGAAGASAGRVAWGGGAAAGAAAGADCPRLRMAFQMRATAFLRS